MGGINNVYVWFTVLPGGGSNCSHRVVVWGGEGGAIQSVAHALGSVSAVQSQVYLKDGSVSVLVTRLAYFHHMI